MFCASLMYSAFIMITKSSTNATVTVCVCHNVCRYVCVCGCVCVYIYIYIYIYIRLCVYVCGLKYFYLGNLLLYRFRYILTRNLQVFRAFLKINCYYYYVIYIKK